MKQFKIKRYKYLLIFLISILGIIAFVNISLNSDEIFTMGIINNTYKGIINYDALDVHPPLYYLILKLYLQMTTFWTSNIFIKIIFARSLSIIIYLIYLYIGNKFLNIIKIHLSSIFAVAFLLMPSVLLYSFYIRMYILAALFLFTEFYELVIYIKTNNNKNLILAVIMGTLSAYTHYFAAISAGLFLLYIFIFYINKKDYKNSIKTFVSGIVFFIMYIPWLIVAHEQFIMATSNEYNTNQIYTKDTYTLSNMLHLFEQVILSLVGGEGTYGSIVIKIFAIPLLILFIYLIFWSFQHMDKQFNIILSISILNLIGTILIGLLVSLIKHPILIDHYSFPSFSILDFLLTYVILNYFKYNFCSSNKVILYIIIFMMFLNVSLYTRFSVQNLFKSHIIVTRMYQWRKANRNFYIKNTKSSIWVIANDSIYLRSLNKIIKTNNFENSNQMFGKSDEKLLHGIYPNIKKK